MTILIFNLLNMLLKKKIFLTILTCFLTFNFSHASFPVTENNSVEFIENVKNSNFNKFIDKVLPPSSSYTAGLLLGLLLGVFGVLIAYILDDREMIRGAWRGMLYGILLILLLYFAVLAVFVGAVTTL